jgi:hypothetical protein
MNDSVALTRCLFEDRTAEGRNHTSAVSLSLSIGPPPAAVLKV